MIVRVLYDRVENVRRVDFVGTVHDWLGSEWETGKAMLDPDVHDCFVQMDWLVTFLRADVIPSPRALELARHDARCARLMREIAQTPLFDPLPPLLYPAATLRKFMLHDLPNA
jgi:hypothetical protein